MYNLRRAVAVVLAVASLATGILVLQSAPASADHRSRLWFDQTQRIGPDKELAIAKEMMGLAMKAAPHCALEYAKDRIRQPVYSTWVSIVLRIAAVTPGCDIAKQASMTAAWLWYYAHLGQSSTVRVYRFQQDRHYMRDLCHVAIRVNGYWLFNAQFLTIDGCPAPTRA